MIFNFSLPKIFHYSKFFMTWNFSWSNNFHDPKFSGTKKFFRTQIFVTQYFLEPVIFELQQFGTHNFLCSKIFRDLNFLEPKFFRIQFIFLTLSKSNPTWNSTEFELVRVDFVFQCNIKKKKNNNNKNPHLIFWDQNFFGTQNFLGPNFFLRPKFFLDRNFLDTNYLGHTFFGTQILLIFS